MRNKPWTIEEKMYKPDQWPVEYSIPQDLANAMFRNGFADTSWRNDICASFTLEEPDQCIRIWIEAQDIDDRESENVFRYVVAQYSSDMEHERDLLETDDLTEAFGCAMRHKSYTKPIDILAEVVAEWREGLKLS